MLLVRGFRAVSPSTALRAPDCRRQRLPAASFEECAMACLAQHFCEAATWFLPEFANPALRGVCVGRTAGQPADFEVQPNAHVALRSCHVPGCGLQARLDHQCLQASRHVDMSHECRGSTVARNRRVMGRHDARLEDYEWICAPISDEDTPNATLTLACVDDRGMMAPCWAPRDNRQKSLSCNARGDKVLHDMQRRGCAPPTCLATPGSGWPLGGASIRAQLTELGASPTPPWPPPLPQPPRPPLPPLPHWVRRTRDVSASPHGRRLVEPLASSSKHVGAFNAVRQRASGSSTSGISSAAAERFHASTSSAAAAASEAAKADARVPTASSLGWTMSRTMGDAPRRIRASASGGRVGSTRSGSGASEPLVSRLRALGYLNCSVQYDELKGGCMAMRPDYDWLQYTWTSPHGAASRSHAAPLTASARALSWWVLGAADGTAAAGADAFDAEAFLRLLATIATGGKANTSLTYGLGGGRSSLPHAIPSALGDGGLGYGAQRELEVLFAGDSTARQQTV